MYMFVILKCLYQAWRVYCCVYVCYIEVPVPSMESVLLCICLLGVSIVSLFLRFSD